MKISTEEHPIFKASNLDLTVLLIPRLQFPSITYKSLATQGHDENSKEKKSEKRGERGVCVCVCVILISPPPFTR